MARVIDISAQTDPDIHGGLMAEGDPSAIILHHTGSRNEDGDIYWLTHNHPDPVSVHKVFKRDGTIVKLLPDRTIAWGAGRSVLNGRADCNTYALQYEIANAGDGSEAYTDAQYESVAQSVAYDCALYYIPDSWVSEHGAVALPPGRKNDPLGWDLPRMWGRVLQIRTHWPFGIPMWCCNK